MSSKYATAKISQITNIFVVIVAFYLAGENIKCEIEEKRDMKNVSSAIYCRNKPAGEVFL